MKKILYLLICFVCISSCDEMEVVPLNKMPSDEVFNDKNLLEAYINTLHGRIPYGYGKGEKGAAWMLASVTDEAVSKSTWMGSNVVRTGNMTPTSLGEMAIWENRYRTIFIANTILDGLKTSPLSETNLKIYEGKVRFIRAWAYFTLVRGYGDVILLTKPQSLEDKLQLPRTAKSEVNDFIYKELQEVVELLPNKSDAQAGEITRQAAIALNARAMLYANRMNKAAELAESLITGDAKDKLALASNYREMLLSNGGSSEAIFEKLTAIPSIGHSWGKYNWPVRWRNTYGGQTCPTQEMVDAYEMAATGLPITDPNSGYDPKHPYDGRDKRFEASIFHHGSEFSKVEPNRGLPFIDMEYNNKNEGPGNVSKNGNASLTGYLVKKFVNPKDGFGPVDYRSSSSWKEIRFAEVLLIFAEAENEVNGPTIAVYSAVNKIRQRAGLPVLKTGLDQGQMRMAIRQERRVELAFENHRWYDLIRWGIAETVLNGYNPTGVKVTRKGSAPSKGEAPQIFDADQLNFELNWDLDASRGVKFLKQYYLLPIQQGELEKNKELKQNPYY